MRARSGFAARAGSPESDIAAVSREPQQSAVGEASLARWPPDDRKRHSSRGCRRGGRAGEADESEPPPADKKGLRGRVLLSRAARGFGESRQAHEHPRAVGASTPREEP